MGGSAMHLAPLPSPQPHSCSHWRLRSTAWSVTRRALAAASRIRSFSWAERSPGWTGGSIETIARSKTCEGGASWLSRSLSCARPRSARCSRFSSVAAVRMGGREPSSLPSSWRRRACSIMLRRWSSDFARTASKPDGALHPRSWGATSRSSTRRGSRGPQSNRRPRISPTASMAPAFWFLLLGLPGLLVYKLVNTADSMIGNRSPRYIAFGWAAARFDDLLEFRPGADRQRCSSSATAA